MQSLKKIHAWAQMKVFLIDREHKEGQFFKVILNLGQIKEIRRRMTYDRRQMKTGRIC